MKKMQQGFTLIELMIVVAIIGILAAIAIPQYQDYITRAKWQDNIARIASFKLAVAECLQNNNGTMSATCDTQTNVATNTGAAQPAVGTAKLASVDYGVTTAGVFTLVGTSEVGNCTVTLTPSGYGSGSTSISWSFANGPTGTVCSKSKTGVG